MNGLEQSSQILDYIRITERPFERLSILEFFDSVDLRCGLIMSISDKLQWWWQCWSGDCILRIMTLANKQIQVLNTNCSVTYLTIQFFQFVFHIWHFSSKILYTFLATFLWQVEDSQAYEVWIWILSVNSTLPLEKSEVKWNLWYHH